MGAKIINVYEYIRLYIQYEYIFSTDIFLIMMVKARTEIRILIKYNRCNNYY